MPWLFSLPEHVVKPLIAGATAILVAVIGVAWPRHRRAAATGKSVVERLGNIEGRLGSVEDEVKQTRSEMNTQLAEIRGYVMQQKK